MKDFFKRNAKLIIITAVLVIALTLTFIALYPYAAEAVNETPVFAYYKLTQIEKMVRNQHIYAAEDDDVLERAYELYTEGKSTDTRRELRRSMVKLIREDIENYYTLANLVLKDYDHYSSLKTRGQYDISYPDTEGYIGLGLSVGPYGPFIRVADVYENSSGDRSGFKAGDLIFSIDGKDIRPLEYEDKRKALGEIRETSVEIGVKRGNEILYFHINIDKVEVPNVRWEIHDDVGVLTVNLFQQKSFKDDLDDAFKDFKKNNIENIIVDLRDNRGGYIDYAVYLLNKFVDQKDEKLFAQTKRNSSKEFTSSGKGHEFENVVVIVNENTCSAAEISSGALKDRGYTLVGTQTYGKAVGLTTYDFFGDKLTLTTLTIELPKTGDYNVIGIEPDIYVENQTIANTKLPTIEENRIDSGSDPKAIEAFETALNTLGYLNEKPDDIWDSNTENALLDFSKAFGLDEDSVCDNQDISTINSLLDSISNAVYIEDTQYKTAYEIIEENKIENAA